MNPTCEEAGSKTSTCSVCGDTKTETIAALGHDTISWEAKAPTCTSIGWDAYVTCKRCDYTTYNELGVVAHAYKAVVTAPTCTEDGYTTYTCSGCNKTYTGDATEKLGHRESAVVTFPDCKNGGYTTYTCTVCGETRIGDEVPANGHTEKAEVTSPNCENGGYTTYTCTVCGETRTGDETAALGHKEETVAGKDATCTATGLTEGKKCSACGKTLVEQEEIAKKPHSYENCACSACGVALPVLDYADAFNFESKGGFEAALASGKVALVGGFRNNGDSYQFSAESSMQFTVPANTIVTIIGHSAQYGKFDIYLNGEKADLTADDNGVYVFTVKAQTNVVIVPNAEATHNHAYIKSISFAEFIDRTIVKDTTIKFGSAGNYKDSIVDFSGITIGDNGGNNSQVKNGSFDLLLVAGSKVVIHGYPGYTSYKLNDGEEITSEYYTYIALEDTVLTVTPVNGNNYFYSIEITIHKDITIVSAKDSTCTEEGHEAYYACSCHGELTDKVVIFKAAHDYKSETTDPTCEEQGYTTYTCSACDDTYKDDYVDALGHTEATDEAVAPTCKETGLTEGKHCSVCNKVLVPQETVETLPHTYYHACDATCNVCGDAREVDGHVYDDENDTICNKCGYDTTGANEIFNGGFESGLDGWTVVGGIGDVSSDTHYWLNDPERAEGYKFGMDGTYMFSAYAPGAQEKLVGTLTSSSFVVGGSGFVTFKVGAMRDGNYVYVDVVDANTKEILARFYNGLWSERTDDVKSGCTLIAYKADLSAFRGREVFFRISDNADSGYGLFFADSFVTYYEDEPMGFNNATPVNYVVSGTIYDVFNGGFEMGDVQGWWNIGEIGVVTNANGYWGDNIPYGKDDEFLFTGVESFGADTMREDRKGTLTSSVFEIGGTGWISFKLGGGGNDLCYVQIIDAVTGEVLARYHQQAQQDAKLIQYVADLSAYIGRTARIQVVDYASSGWGCVSFDSVVTYYPEGAALPEGITANNIFHGNYTVTNGSFENGMDGWHMNIWEAGAHNTLGWVESSEHDAGWYTKNDGRKDGNNLFTFLRPDGTNCENTRGELVSSTFTLKQGTFVSFRFGGAGTRAVRVELVRADGTVIATFFNEAPGKVNTEMFAYYYQYQGETADCFFRVVDDSTSNYGCFVVDDFRANLESAPEHFIPAIP